MGETLTEAVTKALTERLARLEDVDAVEEERICALKALVNAPGGFGRSPTLPSNTATCSATNWACPNDR
jgi:hypothetical protein